MMHLIGFIALVCPLIAGRVSPEYSPILEALNDEEFLDNFARSVFVCDVERLSESDIQTLKMDCENPEARCREQTQESTMVREQNRQIIAAALRHNNFTDKEAEAVSDEACELVFQQKMCRQVSRGIPFIEPANDCLERAGVVAPGGAFFGNFIVRLLTESLKFVTESTTTLLTTTTLPTTTKPPRTTLLSTMLIGQPNLDIHGTANGQENSDWENREEKSGSLDSASKDMDEKLLILCKTLVKAQNLSQQVLDKCLTLDPEDMQALLMLLEVNDFKRKSVNGETSPSASVGNVDSTTHSTTTTTEPGPISPKQLIFRICSLIVHSSDMATANFMRCLKLQEEFYRKRLLSHLQDSIDMAAMKSESSTNTWASTESMASTTIKAPSPTTSSTNLPNTSTQPSTRPSIAARDISLACRADRKECVLCGAGVGVSCPTDQSLFEPEREQECMRECINS